MKQGLIMEGGGMSGVFTAGVMDVLMENGITFDGAIGVSAGAIFGSNIKSKQIGRVIRYNKNYCSDNRFCSVRSFITTGDIFGADFCYEQITYKLDPFDYKAFARNPMEFYCAVTELGSAKAVYHKCSDGKRKDMLWLRASASVPVLSRNVKIGGRYYLDGGIVDSIPIRFFERIGYTRNIVILTKPEGYRMEPADFMFWASIWYRKYPKFIKAIANRHVIYNRTLDYINKKEKDGDIVVIRPSKPTAAAMIEHDPDNLQNTYEDGVSQCKKVLNQIRGYIAKTKAIP